jgi:(p)ppGpp synthase/HD superfamily hydrolase
MEESPLLTERFQDALVFATRLHANQTRKGINTPYVSHLLAVASLVLENGGDEDEAIAALLHDAVEDQGGETIRGEIETRFGWRVAQIVDGVSDTDQFPKPPWRERKEAYLEHLYSSSPSERLVSLADKVHNARSILFDYRQLGEALWSRFRGGKEGTLWYYRSLAEIFKTIHPSPLADELARLVIDMEELVS